MRDVPVPIGGGPVRCRDAAPHRGFTLIELMIVVAIIAIVMAVAIPSLVNSRKSANEARAIGTLRSITTAQEQYKTRFGVYAPTQDDLEHAGYLDVEFSAYDVIGGSGTSGSWSLSVGPLTPADGDRFFFVDTSGVIRFSSEGPATVGSPPIE